MSNKTRARTHKCVHCEKLTNPELDRCDACTYAFTDAEDRKNERSFPY